MATLDDDRRVVVRVPVDAEADAELRNEIRALRALSAGVRGVLPFAAPDVLGETTVEGMHALVQTMLPGYRVDAAHIPAGRGVATTIGAALARVHDLPVSVVRDAGLALMTAGQVRDEAERLLDRAEATGRLPFGLLRRWSAAVASESLWRFETTVVLGGVEPGSFVLEDDDDGVPTVTGLLAWGGLSVGDPAVDLRWLATAPNARDDVLDAYTTLSHRAPDGLLAERARLHAELEFARWLVHGHATGADSIVADAVSLLEALDENVRDEPPIDSPPVTADEAFAARERVPSASTEVDTSMQTDAYHPDMGALFSDDDETADIETVPIELSEWSPRQSTQAPGAHPAGAQRTATDATGTNATAPATGIVSAVDASEDDSPARDELDEAARNALRRWTGTA
ncbi:aminoglycoside phosphotransferase (APT) family kinase protein [Microbacterium invictum]|uniref:Aminoglycoside phosphotransferase (APT) family kinase protein n=1 Tax=Microbacterium invictum TaxID=515415 RepID=A0AA40VLZ4_9MICO|nr:aminoglycoside phosphotransferase (APT) family kinase protein [Microbacterium invictum]